MLTRHSAATHSLGLMALPRSALDVPQEQDEKEAEDVVDQSLLPPG